MSKIIITIIILLVKLIPTVLKLCSWVVYKTSQSYWSRIFLFRYSESFQTTFWVKIRWRIFLIIFIGYRHFISNSIAAINLASAVAAVMANGSNFKLKILSNLCLNFYQHLYSNSWDICRAGIWAQVFKITLLMVASKGSKLSGILMSIRDDCCTSQALSRNRCLVMGGLNGYTDSTLGHWLRPGISGTPCLVHF